MEETNNLTFGSRSVYLNGEVVDILNAPRGIETPIPPRSKKKTRVRVLNPSDHNDTVSLRYAEHLAKHGKARLDSANLTLRMIDGSNDLIAAGRVYKRLHRIKQSPTVEVVPFTEPVDPFGIPTNRIGLPVVPHYSGRSLDDYLDHAEHDARQKAS